jgi:hypothetical protein
MQGIAKLFNSAQGKREIVLAWGLCYAGVVEMDGPSASSSGN